jgi:hypothetical protein
MAEHFDGTETMPYVFHDGGRAAAGYKGKAGDCVVRSVAIAGALPYVEVYAALADGMGTQRKSKGRTPRNGVNTKRKWFKDYMQSIGFVWTPTMAIGQGCKVHLLKGELPQGRLIVALSKHYTAVIDGVIYDTFDPSRASLFTENGVTRISHRCVYGYWQRAA